MNVSARVRKAAIRGEGRWLAPIAVSLLAIGLSCDTSSAQCQPDSLVIDPAGSFAAVSALWGEAPGQTFIAEDTTISAITVWRIKNQAVNISDMQLWITEVDSTGRPQNNQIVFEGPVLRVMYGDGINPVEIRFALDPPAVLPHRGKFAFFIQNRCNWFFDLLINDGTDYPGGELWRSETSNYHGCVLWGIYDRFDQADLSCKIEFCHDKTTAIPRKSWGGLKVLYR